MNSEVIFLIFSSSSIYHVLLLLFTVYCWWKCNKNNPRLKGLSRQHLTKYGEVLWVVFVGWGGGEGVDAVVIRTTPTPGDNFLVVNSRALWHCNESAVGPIRFAQSIVKFDLDKERYCEGDY